MRVLGCASGMLFVYLSSCFPTLVRLTWEVEAAVPVVLGRGVGWRSGAWGVALLEGRWGGGGGGGGGGRVAAGVQLVQHRRMVLVGARGAQTRRSELIVRMTSTAAESLF